MLSRLLGGSLHPGGPAATERLLRAAGVREGTRLLDAGCGGGASLALARKLKAHGIGLLRAAGGHVRGETARLPFRDGSFDVVLSECALCLSADATLALSEFRRVLAADGRLALSDVTLERPRDAFACSVGNTLCLAGAVPMTTLVARVRDAGFSVTHEADRGGDVRELRNAIRRLVDVDALLPAVEPAGGPLTRLSREGEAALEAGELSYLELVATRRG